MWLPCTYQLMALFCCYIHNAIYSNNTEYHKCTGNMICKNATYNCSHRFQWFFSRALFFMNQNRCGSVHFSFFFLLKSIGKSYFYFNNHLQHIVQKLFEFHGNWNFFKLHHFSWITLSKYTEKYSLFLQKTEFY